MDRETIFTFTIALIVITVVYTGIRLYLRQRTLRQLGTLLYSGNFESYKAKFNTKLTKIVLTPLEQELFTLDEGFLSVQEETIRGSLERLENYKLNDQQKGLVHSKAFYFFMSSGEIESAKHYYTLLLDNPQYHDKYNLKRVYNTYIDKGYQYLDETLEQAKSNPGYYAIIADMYHNKGDIENHNKYVELFKQHMDSTKKQ